MTGTIGRIVYHSNDTHYSVLIVEIEGSTAFGSSGSSSSITVVGNFPDPREGERIEVQGRWTDHPRYGEQFRGESFRILLPTTEEGVRRFLGYGPIPGIGPKLADRIVDAFGENTFEILDQEPDRLLGVSGIGKRKLEGIVENWCNTQQYRATMTYFQGFGIPSRIAQKLHDEYGDEAIPLIRKNPYRLVNEVFGIGFKTADRIAIKMGMPKESPERGMAGIHHCLYRGTSQGHTYLPREELLGFACELLDADRSTVEKAFDSLLLQEKLILISDEIDQPVYIPLYYRAEQEVAKKLRLLQTVPGPFSSTNVPQRIADHLAQGLLLTSNQREAIRTAIVSKVSIITGGPGVGKTTIIQGLVSLFEDNGIIFNLTAPTGRAAKRLSQATGYPASTLHRLLRYLPQEGRFEHDQDNPLEAGAVIVDEASMVDIRLMQSLSRALQGSTLLILVGDVDQLPSVGAGNVLSDLLESQQIPSVRLDEVFRQGQSSRIVENAHRINRGEWPLTNVELDDTSCDFFFVQKEDPTQAAQAVLELVANRIPLRYGIDSVSDIQVITPMHRGEVGTQKLNELLQERLNPDGLPIPFGSVPFRIGDKVMQIKNDYDKEVFNGDTGRIVHCHEDHSAIEVSFEDRIVEYPLHHMDQLRHAYAISVHKSQGSEYPALVMTLLPQHHLLLQRNLLYTGITRGKDLVILVGSRKALDRAIRNDRPSRRYSRLAQVLRDHATPSLWQIDDMQDMPKS
ncbi:MAG: ATP-dependent RecD-like DNA helicase [Planctomycetota bacterium]|nr:ATP-dependent RecD-like DNA helicase [Planctomycetota bacterium]